jgi:HPt (histidine-containing phosphotransfer) domain-containing protein
MFLSHGFDGYISKPIDIRDLNAILHRLICDKQPPEVIEAARREIGRGKSAPIPELARKILSSERLTSAVIRDIGNAIAVLDGFLLKQGSASEEDIESYITSVHGMKSALANIGEAGLSSIADELEQAGKNNDMAAMLSETQGFIESLQSVIEKIKPKEV